MSIEKTINVKVNTGNSEAELKSLETGFKNVDAAAEKTGKSVDDVASNGGAIAVLDQLTGGLATRFKDAYEASKLFNISLKGMRTALIASGIGLFVVALGTVVLYWDEINDAISGTSRKIQDQIDRANVYANSLTVQLGLIESQIKLAGQQKINDKELLAKKVEILNKLIETNQKEIDGLNIQAAKIKSAAFELSLREKIVKAVLNAASAGSGDAYILEGQLEDSKKYLELQDLITTAKKEQVDTSIKLFELENPEAASGTSLGTKRDKVVGVNGLSSETSSDIEKAKLDIEIAGIEARRIEVQGDFDFRQSLRALELEEEKEAADKKIELEKSVNDAKYQIANNTFGLIGMLAKKGSKLAKGVAVAQTLMNTYQGITAALAAPSTVPEPFGFALKLTNAATVGVMGLLNAKKILSTDESGRGGSQGGSSGGGGRSAPSFNLVQGTGSSHITDTLQNQRQPLKAYVVSSDMSSAQAIDRNIKENATI